MKFMVLEEAIYHKTLCTGLSSLTVHHCKLEGDVKHSQDTTKNSLNILAHEDDETTQQAGLPCFRESN